MVPHLVTALNGPINELEQRILESMSAIERWFRLEWMEHTPAFYCAVDVRNAGFKLAPVDTNLYPDGWNNLSPEMLPLAVQAAMAAIEKICPEAKNLLLVPDNDIHNSFYLSNLARLARIFNLAGLNVRLGSLSNEVKAPVALSLPDGESITLEPLIRSQYRLGLKDFDPCTILLNNGLAAGVPGILEELHEQYLLPPLHASWRTRRKSNHAKAYEEIAKRFAKMLGMDHWLINPAHAICNGVGPDGGGLDELKTQADAVLTKIRRKYKEYGIQEKPFVVIKPDDGSSAAGIWAVRDAKELDELASRIRQVAPRTEAGQGGGPLMVQEGVLTHERINDAVAEPVVYMMDRYVVGGYYRVHAERGEEDNLNAPGARFLPLAFEQSAHLPQPGMKPGVSAPNRFYMYGVMGRLAMLASSYELEATDPEADNTD
jgi:glutamate--cysteine ligase